MASNKLFSLFDEKMRSSHELVAGPEQTLDSLGATVESSEELLLKIRQFENATKKVDYSEFSNFVFFNSALDYFNITGEKILNEYPYDGTSDSIRNFIDALDDYQRYVLSVWPKSTSHLKFDPTYGFASVSIDDVGLDDNGSRTSILNPGTSSLSVEFWAVTPPTLTGSQDVMVVLQKMSGSGDGFSVYFSGSQLHAVITSGSTTDSASAQVAPGNLTYFGIVYDRTRSDPILNIYTGSAGEFPRLTSYYTGSIIGSIAAGTSKLTMCSGSVQSKVVRPFTGSLDDVRLWKDTLTINDISSSFNARIYAQAGLYGLWRFNESGSIPSTSGDRVLVRDHSGRKLHGSISSYYPEIRASGSLLPFDVGDVLLSLDAPAVSDYVASQQSSGTSYDRDNDNLITRLLPEQFFLLEEFKGTDVLKNFLFVIARHFDHIKISIDQFAHVLKTNYGYYNQSPDALLQDIAKFFGWEFTGNFLNADAVQYIAGRNILQNVDANRYLDTKLYEIKNEFWKRTLVNLMHIYKTKGTRESVETLLKVYGLNKNFVRLKEYGYKPNAGIQTHRIHSEKSVPVLTFGSGSSLYTSNVTSVPFYDRVMSVESRVKFPTTISSYLTSSITTGSIWSLNDYPSNGMRQKLFFVKSDATSLTGSLVYTGSEGSLTITNIPMFDNRWYNVVVSKDYTSSSLEIDVRRLNVDVIDYHVTASLQTTLSTSSFSGTLWMGATGSTGSQMWAQEVRLWSEPLMDNELIDHALNFQSFGTENVDGTDDLIIHWRLDENVTASSGGYIQRTIFDYSGRDNNGSGSGFIANANPYRKFLNDYNYIAPPEMGWNEEKIRSLDSSRVTPSEAFVDNNVISLEFNLVDSLNEDMSQILSTLDIFNEYVGSPANMYRDSYPDLDALRARYFGRLRGSINFTAFIDMLEFFDRSFVGMIRRLLPARAVFVGDEVVIESHMLERPKLQWNYRRKDPEFQPEGVIKVYIRT